MPPPQARRVNLIEVDTTEGAGTPEDPTRLIKSYFRDSGTLVARLDPLMMPECICDHAAIAHASSGMMPCLQSDCECKQYSAKIARKA